MQTTRNYQVLARQFVTFPLIITLLVTFCIFLVVNLRQTIRNEIHHAETINQLLIQPASSNNDLLLAQQIKNVLEQSLTIENIVFYPTTQSQTVNNHSLTIQQLFFSKYHSLTLSVINQNVNNQLSGYMMITLDLAKIRKQWLKKNLPMFISISLLTVFMVLFTLFLLQKQTRRLPKLQQASQDILNNKKVDISDLLTDNNQQIHVKNEPLWLVEEAIIHLLNEKKQLLYQLQQVQHDKQALQDKQLEIIKQNSNFQNTFNHEFKSSLNKITAGVRLLESQYISTEQQDAVNMINFAIDGLNVKLNQLQMINHLEKNQIGIKLSRFSPTMIIQDVIQIYQQSAHEKDIDIQTKFYHADYVLSGDTQKITLILSSLLDNAVKFTDIGSIIITSKLQHLSQSILWEVSIEDTGIGIAPEYQNKIFEPFFQLHSERRHSLNSQNIGLYLIKRLTEMLHGSLNFDTQEGEGSTFYLTLTLDDWDTHQQQLTLQDKQISLWHGKHTPDIHALDEAGATLNRFTDPNLLLNHLLNHNTDILLITADISPQDIMNFVRKIREFEQHHRVLIVYYYPTKFTNYQKPLQMTGVDYLEESAENEVLSADYLEKLLTYLH